ncbi:MAG: hypothetical protein Aurels2KO_39580 [Aureliella sp.]
MKHDNGWSTQIASDVTRDGLGVELLSSNGEIIAEAFRCDAENTVSVACWSSRVTDEVLGWLLPYAHAELHEFEDGTALPPWADWPVAHET